MMDNKPIFYPMVCNRNRTKITSWTISFAGLRDGATRFWLIQFLYFSNNCNCLYNYKYNYNYNYN